MTPPFTLQFAGDSGLNRLHSDLIAAGQTDAALDQGYSSVDYPQVRAGNARGAQDRVLDPAELFNPIISDTTLAPAYRRFAGEALPWVPDTSLRSTQTALQRFDQDVAEWRRQHHLPTGINRDLAQHIFRWVTDPQGLNLQVTNRGLERNFDEMVDQGLGDCTEFTKVLLALYTRVGATPFPVWVGVDSQGDRVNHITTGLTLSGRTVLVDPVYGHFDEAHRSYTRLSLREFLGWHWNNRALDQQISAPDEALRLFRRALQIDPANPHILFNRALFQRDRRQDLSAARSDLQAALSLDSRFDQAEYELGNIEFDAGNFSQAANRYRRALTLFTGDERYHHDLVVALLRNGDMGEAKRRFETFQRQFPNYDRRELVRLSRIVGSQLLARAGS